MRRFQLAIFSLAFLAACTPSGDKEQAQDAQIVQTAENLKHSGDTAGAVRVLREAQTSQPDNPLILSQLGSALIGSGQPQEAISVFDHLMTLHPDNVSAYNGKAVAFDRTGNHTAAQELYRQALKLSPDSLSIKNNLSMSMIMNDQIDEAIAMLEELNRQSGSNQTVRQNLALAYGIKGDKDKALALNLQDLPEAEAKENVHFYEQYASEHKKNKVAAAVPAKAPAPLAEETPASLNDLLSHATAEPAPLPQPAAAPPIPAASVQDMPKVQAEDKAAAAPSAEEPFTLHIPQPDANYTYPSKSKPSHTVLPTSISVQNKSGDNMQNLAPAAGTPAADAPSNAEPADSNADDPAQGKQ